MTEIKTSKSKLFDICVKQMQVKSLDRDPAYVRRLKDELIEIDVQSKYDYFIEHHEKGSYWDNNHRNLLVPYLLGLCPACNIASDPASVMGEYPDIDSDFIEPVRDYLRIEWAPKQFGRENVAFIATYSTYNLKQSLNDMARVFGLDRHEILNITKQFAVKDDEGDLLTWDAALELYPAFKQWCETNPEAADAAKMLHGRNRSMGQHAGGFIVSNQRLEGFVPLVKNKKDESMMTAWTEGQSSQDLMKVGLVKIDALGSKMQEQITDCVGLILKRYKLPGLFMRPGAGNWSDDSYLDDPEALKMANAGDLRFIFQFDSDGIRRLARKGGVTCFQDLEAYSALYRPGPLNSGMHDTYCDRKKGLEEYTIHPVLEPHLKETYGVMVFQEQVMLVLHAAGRVAMRDAYEVVKAISKKKIEKFAKYKELFISNSQETLGISQEEAETMWQQIEEFAAYGFNKSHTCAYTHQSAKQLVLKCHYPLEFFCTMLNQISGDDDKLRDCRRNAESHGVKVNPINIHRSTEFFSIYSPGEPSPSDEIYFGLSNIKFVGEEVAKRIVEARKQRPFDGFRDFLDRFGTDAKAVFALVTLGAFDDAPPLVLWKYYEYYKQNARRREDRRKRFSVAMEKYHLQFHELAGPGYVLTESEIDRAIENAKDEDCCKGLRRLKGNFRRSFTTFESKEKEEQAIVDLADFDHESCDVTLKPDIKEVLEDREKAEMHFYGFCWSNPLDSCPMAEGYTFERFKAKDLAIGQVGPLEGIIQESRETVSKKGNKYRVVKLMDANWEIGYISFWAEENERFKNQLKVGNMVRLRVTPPDPKFGGSRYALESYPPYKRKSAPAVENDFRVVLLKAADTGPDPSLVTQDEADVTLVKIIEAAKSEIRREYARSESNLEEV